MMCLVVKGVFTVVLNVYEIFYALIHPVAGSDDDDRTGWAARHTTSISVVTAVMSMTK